MHVNGVETEKENSEQRLARYIAEFKRRYDQANREQVTGELCLAVDLNGGHPRRRSIRLNETKT